jgi:hypothetical protein
MAWNLNDYRQTLSALSRSIVFTFGASLRASRCTRDCVWSRSPNFIPVAKNDLFGKAVTLATFNGKVSVWINGGGNQWLSF